MIEVSRACEMQQGVLWVFEAHGSVRQLQIKISRSTKPDDYLAVVVHHVCVEVAKFRHESMQESCRQPRVMPEQEKQHLFDVL